MLHSMTGYGRAEVAFKDKTFLIEVKSLNGKQFDLRLNIPSLLKQYEIEIRNKLNESLFRGSVECSISVKSMEFPSLLVSILRWLSPIINLLWNWRMN